MPVARAAVASGVANARAQRKGRRRSSILAEIAAAGEDGDGSTRQRELRRMMSDGKGLWRKDNIGAYGNEYHDRLAKCCRDRVRDKAWFSTSLIGVIFLAGLLVGITTYNIEDQGVMSVLETLDDIVLSIFILEIVVKMVAEGKAPWKFFNDAWNVFDFTIVVVGLLPFSGGAVKALRLVRLLRVLKLVRALPKLRILVMGLFLSMSSIAYIGLLLMLLFYLFAVLGVSVFGKNDPVHFGTLHFAVLTLFRCATLEDWTDVMYINMYGCASYGYGGMEELCTKDAPSPILSVAYFVMFTVLSSMMILNLFIGVITSSMAEAKSDLEEEGDALEDAAKAKNASPGPDLATLIKHETSGLCEDLRLIADELRACGLMEVQRKNAMRSESVEDVTLSPEQEEALRLKRAAIAAKGETDEHWMTPVGDEPIVVSQADAEVGHLERIR
eukprot:CAMPEP_0203834592 /NCGR_PEP_ID=MMETSP0115-20131106/73237_1 /ASSEMBLY_ACC=CAM_ASM_000227 /TAXON_ID=33651 /ORGANISM="Bicosoecid sp, Strain ms1" /LENGTH=442 /DNA_ID=CAMNT_0050743671 /DNA_START=48 /DNA_END=1372 /DNA_ORIENTATION=+